MALIRIINGTYGMRVNGYAVERKTPEDEPFEVDDAEAERLAVCGVAAIVVSENPAPAAAPEAAETVPEYNAGMKLTELKAIAEGLGIDAAPLKSKAAVIERLDALFGR